jgi:hypothetical protein
LNDVSKFLSLFVGVILLFVAIGYMINLGAPRTLHFAMLLFPVFSSVLILRVSKNKRAKVLICPLIFLSIMFLATIELYDCQPIVPPANVLFKDLPPNIPMSYINLVNTIYQRQMIGFAENHVEGKIACASPTANQIVGLTEINFSVSYLVRYYPLDKGQREQGYEYFLINLPGKSGTPLVEARLRSPSLILGTVYDSNVIYTNGESYILGHTR